MAVQWVASSAFLLQCCHVRRERQPGNSQMLITDIKKRLPPPQHCLYTNHAPSPRHFTFIIQALYQSPFTNHFVSLHFHYSGLCAPTMLTHHHFTFTIQTFISVISNPCLVPRHHYVLITSYMQWPTCRQAIHTCFFTQNIPLPSCVSLLARETRDWGPCVGITKLQLSVRLGIKLFHIYLPNLINIYNFIEAWPYTT